MGKLPQPERKYEVQALQDRHREIIRLHILGEANTTIAARVGCSAQMVSYVLNSQIAKNHIATLQGQRDESAVDVNERLTALSEEAVMLYQNILRKEEDGKNASLALQVKVADSILDRAGFGKTSKMEVESKSLVLRSEDIEGIKERAAARKLKRVSNEARPSQVIGAMS